MQIHHLEVRHTHEKVLDPVNGRIVLKRNEYLAAGATTAITYEGEEYQVQPDGTFDVPNEVAAYYLNQAGWFVGDNPFLEQITADAERNTKAAEEKRAETKRIAAEEAEAHKVEEAAAKKAEETKSKPARKD